MEQFQQEFHAQYSQRMINSLFIVIFISNVVINIDHGVLPACYQQIQAKLKMNELQYGILGSFVFGGLMLGSFVSTGVYSKGHYIKPVLISSLILAATCLVLFVLTNSYTFSLFLRGATGFFQIFLIAFQPVWSDTFCSDSFKSIALTINMLASPIGIVGGYLLTYYMNIKLSWEWSFIIQAIALVPCFVFLIIVPEKYLNIEMTIKNRKLI